jgi:hypothetical protein
MNRLTRFSVLISTAILVTSGCKSAGNEAYSHSPDGSTGHSHVGPVGAEDVGGGDYRGTAQAAPIAQPQSAGRAAKNSAAADMDMEMAEEMSRPGLGTSYGESHYSHVGSTSFERRRARRPDRVLSIRYNDYQGVEAVASKRGANPRWGQAINSEAGFTVRVMDDGGNTLPGGYVGGKTFALGHPGERYMLAVENSTSERVEVVASVDGVDVISGDDASFRHRGYVVPPWSSVQIDGWRTSEQSVAAFRFSSVAESYAARTGRGRDVGVIGFAFFSEAPRYEPEPQRYAPPPPYDPQRDRANPFPGR